MKINTTTSYLYKLAILPIIFLTLNYTTIYAAKGDKTSIWQGSNQSDFNNVWINNKSTKSIVGEALSISFNVANAWEGAGMALVASADNQQAIYLKFTGSTDERVLSGLNIALKSGNTSNAKVDQPPVRLGNYTISSDEEVGYKTITIPLQDCNPDNYPNLYNVMISGMDVGSFGLVEMSTIEGEIVLPDLSDKPNVLFIMCDDLNDYIGVLGGHKQAHTPNIDRLAAMSTRFTNGQSNTPVCQPSRNSLFTGVYSFDSGDFGWQTHTEQQVLKHNKTLMQLFQENGYYTLGTGKLLHSNEVEVWNEWGEKTTQNYGPYVFDGTDRVSHPSVPAPFSNIGPVDGAYGRLSGAGTSSGVKGEAGWVSDWAETPFRYINENDRDLLPDEKHAKWAVDKLEKFETNGLNKPFFMGVGFVRPHTPLYAPDRFFDMFPLEEIELADWIENDLDDTFSNFEADNKGPKYYRELVASYNGDKELALKHFLQAYLACVAFVDEQIGIVLDGLANSSFKDNTIIVFTSDHGWQMGEKEYLFKNSVWEESARVPYIVHIPEAQKGTEVEHPVSLIDLYPTLVDYCGLQGDHKKNDNGADLGGFSLRPFIENPQTVNWDGPEGALTLRGNFASTSQNIATQNYSYRTKDWRYIHYSDGSEELYDHNVDKHEWHNLAGDATYRSIKNNLRAQVNDIIGVELSTDDTEKKIVTTATVNACNLSSSQWQTLAMDAANGSKTIVFNYNRCPLDVPSSTHLAFDVENNSQSDIMMDVVYQGEWSSDIQQNRHFISEGETKQTKTLLARKAADNLSSWYPKFEGLRGLPGGHVVHWAGINNVGIKKITVTVSWKNHTAGSENIRIKTPYGTGDYTFNSISPSNLPKPLVDEMGQLAIGTWDGKLTHKSQLSGMAQQDITKYTKSKVNDKFSKYGGWKSGIQLEATGYFYTTKHQGRWWLVDPEGYLFWSQGVTGVGSKGTAYTIGKEDLFPTFADEKSTSIWSLLQEDITNKDINFYAMNLKRKYGTEWESKHYDVSVGRLKQWGMNTTGAWSHVPEVPTHPYTLIIHPRKDGIGAIDKIPDPFSTAFVSHLRTLLNFTKERKEDPFLLGIFVNNELDWGKTDRSIADEVLKLDNAVPARKAMEDFLKEKYTDIATLNTAWRSSFTSFADINANNTNGYSTVFNNDMVAYFEHFANTYYRIVAEEVRKVLPNHLYLGSRLHEKVFENKAVQRAASRYCDVVSFNIYKFSVKDFEVEMDIDKPCIIGEFHFGTGTHGVWGTGLKSAADLENQADLYQQYIQEASEHPSFVGAHWFQWVDQSVLGRKEDGENFRIGLVNITDQPYDEMVTAVKETSVSLYEGRSGQLFAFNNLVLPYNGEQQTPTIIPLLGTTYTVELEGDATEIGEYTMTVISTDANFQGSSTVKFEIVDGDEIINSLVDKRAVYLKVTKDGIQVFGDLPFYHITVMDFMGRKLLDKTANQSTLLPYNFREGKQYIIRVNNTVTKRIF